MRGIPRADPGSADWSRAFSSRAIRRSIWIAESSCYALTAHTGYPITVVDSSNPSLQASHSTERPNRIGSGEVEHPTLEHWIDRSAFVSAPLGQFGNSGIGILRAPGYWNLDLSVGKRVASAGGQYVLFRAELFNALNHPNFGPPQANIQSTAFGTITSTVGDARIVQLVVKYESTSASGT